MPCVPKPKSQRRDYYAELGLKRGVWHAQLVGLVPRYKKTAEAFARGYEKHAENMSKYRLSGVINKGPDAPLGMLTYEFARLQNKAAAQAQTIVERMATEDPELTPSALKALAVAAEIMLTRDENTGKAIYAGTTRIAAARLICDFVQAKPAQRVDATVTRAEDFLTVLANKQD